MSSKRPRSPSPSSSRSSASPPLSSSSSKLPKVVPDVLYTSRTCTLPPTCSYPRKPTLLSSPHEIEEHYAKYHTHVCEHERCMCVFPDARFLELHIAECHDPITALKKERGEKIFACYLASCPRVFMTPKGRRLHLIQSHGYPKQFFFAVTNKGIGGLLHKWGEGASLYRGDWKPRSQDHDMKSASESGDGDDDDDDNQSECGSEMDAADHGGREVVDGERELPQQRVASSGDDDRNLDDTMELPPMSSFALHSPSSTTRPSPLLDQTSVESDTLTNAMSSLTLVPDKIRFGRGGKKGGFAHSRTAKSSTAPAAKGLQSDMAPPDRIVEKEKEKEKEKGGEKKCFRGRGGRRRTQGLGSERASSMDKDPDAAAPV